MKTLTINILLFLALVCGCARPENTSELGIAFGRLATANDAATKSTIALLMYNKEFCSAAVIGTKHLLTAAHCIDAILKGAGIRGLQFGFGPNGILNSAVSAARLFRHKGYRVQFTDPVDDVGLIILNSTLPSGYIPVKIAPDNGVTFGTPVLVAGYGVTGQNFRDNGRLRLRDTSILGFDRQKKRLTLISVVRSGDSGGPTFYRNPQTSELYVVGVTSAMGSLKDYLGFAPAYSSDIASASEQAGSPIPNLIKLGSSNNLVSVAQNVMQGGSTGGSNGGCNCGQCQGQNSGGAVNGAGQNGTGGSNNGQVGSAGGGCNCGQCGQGNGPATGQTPGAQAGTGSGCPCGNCGQPGGTTQQPVGGQNSGSSTGSVGCNCGQCGN